MHRWLCACISELTLCAYCTTLILSVIVMSTCEPQPLRDYEWATQINRVCLRICGTWPTSRNALWMKACDNIRVVLLAVSIITLSLFPQTLALIKVWGNLNLMCDNLIIYLPFAVSECKIITLWYHKEVIGKMIESIKADWLKEKTEEERTVMLKYAAVGRTITISGYTVALSTVIIYHPPLIFGFVLRTVTNLTDTGDRRFVLQTVYLFDAYRSPIYELTVISQTFVCFVSASCYTTAITLFGVVVLHVSSQLEILTTRIEKMARFNHDYQHFQDIFKSNVKEHLRLIRFVNSIEKTFNMMLLQVVVTFSLTVCIQVFQIMDMVSDMNPPLIRTTFSMIYFAYIVFIMFVYTAVGETLLIQGQGIQWAAYNCNWYDLKPREAAQLIPMIVQAQRPLKITAGKFVPVTLETFAALQKTTAGYISFLLTIEE